MAKIQIDVEANAEGVVSTFVDVRDAGEEAFDALREAIDPLGTGLQNVGSVAHDLLDEIDPLGVLFERVAAETKAATAAMEEGFGDASIDAETLSWATKEVAKAAIEAARESRDLADAEDEASESSEGLKVKTVALGTVIGNILTGALNMAVDGLRGLAGQMGEWIDQSNEGEAASFSLAAALRAANQPVDDLIGKYSALADAYQETARVQDDEVLRGMAKMVQIGGVQEAQMERSLQAALDLAAGLGIELDAAFTIVAKAAAGNTELLGRYGIEIEKTDDRAKGLDLALEAISGQFGGQATAAAATYGSQMKGLGLSIDKTGQSLANLLKEAVLPYIAKAQELVPVVQQWIAAHREDVLEHVKDILETTVSVIDATATAVGFLADHWEFLVGLFGAAVFTALPVTLGAVSTAIGSLGLATSGYTAIMLTATTATEAFAIASGAVAASLAISVGALAVAGVQVYRLVDGLIDLKVAQDDAAFAAAAAADTEAMTRRQQVAIAKELGVSLEYLHSMYGETLLDIQKAAKTHPELASAIEKVTAARQAERAATEEVTAATEEATSATEQSTPVVQSCADALWQQENATKAVAEATKAAAVVAEETWREQKGLNAERQVEIADLVERGAAFDNDWNKIGQTVESVASTTVDSLTDMYSSFTTLHAQTFAEVRAQTASFVAETQAQISALQIQMGISSGTSVDIDESDPGVSRAISRVEEMLANTGTFDSTRGVLESFLDQIENGDLIGADRIVDAIRSNAGQPGVVGTAFAQQQAGLAFGLGDVLRVIEASVASDQRALGGFDAGGGTAPGYGGTPAPREVNAHIPEADLAAFRSMVASVDASTAAMKTLAARPVQVLLDSKVIATAVNDVNDRNGAFGR